jgi:phosphocarrier protein HPr
MNNFKLTVVNSSGIHARPSGKIVEVTNRAISDVRMKYNGILANAKSILNIMMLAVEPGAEVEFFIEGEDEEKVGQELTELFERKFDEDS